MVSQHREFSGSLTPRAYPGGNDSSDPQTDIVHYSSCCLEDTEVDLAFSIAALWCPQKVPCVSHDLAIPQEESAADSPHRPFSAPAGEKQTL